MEGPFDIGTRVRVKIAGTRGEPQPGFDMQSTNTVTELTGPTKWEHYLYLGSSVVTGKNGGTVEAEFDAEISGGYALGKNGTTLVTEILPRGGSGCKHLVYLNSSAVTPLDGVAPEPDETPDASDLLTTKAKAARDLRKLTEAEPPRTPVTRENGQSGAKVRVRMNATVGTRTTNSRQYGTTRVVDDTSSRWTHFLFVNSDKVTGGKDLNGGKAPGGVVTVIFDAVISGDYEAGDINTTEVREISTDGSFSYTHFLYLDSDCISLLEPSTGNPLSELKAATTRIEKDKKEKTTVQIDRYDEEITYSQVQERMEELEDATEAEYEVIRLRNDETLATYSDEDDAREYIEDNDYNPERVIVRETDADEDDVNELSNLNELNNDCAGTFGSAWGEGDVTLYSDNYFDSDWARNQAADLLNISEYTCSDWPLNLIDWEEAAEQRRDADYTAITFDGGEFYGADQ